MAIDVTEVRIAGQQSLDARPFPLVLQNACGDVQLPDVVGWVSQQASQLQRQAAQVGAILFRGFGIQTAEQFDSFVGGFGQPNFPYEESLSNAVRVNRTPRVFTANEAPSEVTIFLHHEMAQTPVAPSELFFFCQQPAESGGATPLCRSDVLLERLQQRLPEFVRDCESKGLRYSHVMPGEADPESGMGRSWKSTLRAENREAAEQRLAGLGYTWEWIEHDCLRVTTPVLPAVRELPSGKKSFFNQLIAAYQGWHDHRNDPSRAITFGDGQPLEHGDVGLAYQLAEELTFDLPWQLGDVALLDNDVVMHGRRPFTGRRQVLASLVGRVHQPAG